MKTAATPWKGKKDLSFFSPFFLLFPNFLYQLFCNRDKGRLSRQKPRRKEREREREDDCVLAANDWLSGRTTGFFLLLSSCDSIEKRAWGRERAQEEGEKEREIKTNSSTATCTYSYVSYERLLTFHTSAAAATSRLDRQRAYFECSAPSRRWTDWPMGEAGRKISLWKKIKTKNVHRLFKKNISARGWKNI